MKSGIYKIICKIDKRVYVGQSVDIKRRLNDHRRKLKQNKHANEYLQRAFLKHGEDNFSFTVIEYCEIEDLDNRECRWIEFYDSMNRSKGFNLESGGSKNKRFCQERISAITGEGNPMFGRKHSQEYIEFIRLHNRGSSDKLTEDDVKNIKLSLIKGYSMKKLADEYDVDYTTISKINTSVNWYWVLPELNEELKNKEKKQKEIRDNEIMKFNKEGFSNIYIANKLNIGQSTVSRILKNNGILGKNDEIKNLTNQIVELHKKSFSNKEIALVLEINNKTVAKVLKENNRYSKIRGSSKLTEKDIPEIRKILKEGKLSVKSIAEMFDVKRQTITDIKFNRTWRHVV